MKNPITLENTDLIGTSIALSQQDKNEVNYKLKYQTEGSIFDYSQNNLIQSGVKIEVRQRFKDFCVGFYINKNFAEIELNKEGDIEQTMTFKEQGLYMLQEMLEIMDNINNEY